MERREMVVSRVFCARDDPEGLSLTRDMDKGSCLMTEDMRK